MKLHFRSNDREGLRWQQRTADIFRRALGRLQGLVAGIQVRHQPRALVPVRTKGRRHVVVADSQRRLRLD